MGMLSFNNSFIVELFDIFRYMSMIFLIFSEFIGIFSKISPDSKVLLLGLEWHNPVSWKLK